MEYLLIAAVVVVLLLTQAQTAQLADELTSIQQRRNLVLRLSGFVVMSVWLHLLPSLLMLIYMRHHGFFAPEVFGADSTRAIAVSVYLTPLVLIGAFLFSFPTIAARLTSRKLATIVAVVVLSLGAVVLLYFIGLGNDKDWNELRAFSLVVSTLIAAYFGLTLCGSLAVQIRFWFFPFLLVASVSSALFYYSAGVSKLVGQQLMEFKSGGGIAVSVERGSKFYAGSLLLTTTDATYISLSPWADDRIGYAPCIVRIPLSDSVVSTNVDRGLKDTIRSCLP